MPIVRTIKRNNNNNNSKSSSSSSSTTSLSLPRRLVFPRSRRLRLQLLRGVMSSITKNLATATTTTTRILFAVALTFICCNNCRKWSFNCGRKSMKLKLKPKPLLHIKQQQQQQQYSLSAIIIGLFLCRLCVSGQIHGYTAGIDYPTYETIPKGLTFNCQGRLPGYYADIETRCQVWHWCLHSGHQYSFLCPNGTVFNQAVRVCDWWTNVNCPDSEQLYRNNEELYRVEQMHLDGNNI